MHVGSEMETHINSCGTVQQPPKRRGISYGIA